MFYIICKHLTLNTLLHEATHAADASLQNFTAVGVVRFQDNDRGRRKLDDNVFGCFASVQYILLKNNEILQSVREL